MSSLACESPTAPRVPSGTYLLRDVAGMTLPAVLYDSAGFRVILLQDRVTFALDGTGERSSRYRYETTGPVPDAVERTETSALETRVVDGELRIGELLFCVDALVLESCPARRDAPASWTGATLQIGPRRYQRSSFTF